MTKAKSNWIKRTKRKGLKKTGEKPKRTPKEAVRPSDTENTELLKEEEAAWILRLDPSTLQNWRVLGHGPPFVRLGRKRGRVFYRRADLTNWLTAKTRTCTTEDRGTDGPEAG